MKLYIPAIGDLIQLTTDWTFDLYNEHRNATLMEHIGDTREPEWYKSLTTIPCTIPAGSVLRIDRVFIRKGAAEYESVTFFWKGAVIPNKMVEERNWRNPRVPKLVKKPKKPVRFWAKLADVNNIEFDHVPD